MSLTASDRADQPGGESPGCRSPARTGEIQVPSFIRRRPDARGALHPERRRQRRTAACTRSSPSTAFRCARLRSHADPISRRSYREQQRDLPHSHAGVRRRPDRADSRQARSSRTNAAMASEAGTRNQRARPNIVRRPDHHPVSRTSTATTARLCPLRVEGAEQVAPAVLGRGLQRRDGHHQRALSDRARRDLSAISRRQLPTT